MVRSKIAWIGGPKLIQSAHLSCLNDQSLVDQQLKHKEHVQIFHALSLNHLCRESVAAKRLGHKGDLPKQSHLRSELLNGCNFSSVLAWRCRKALAKVKDGLVLVAILWVLVRSLLVRHKDYPLVSCWSRTTWANVMKDVLMDQYFLLSLRVDVQFL